MSEATPTTEELNSQYRRPSGELGKQVGKEMARNHLPENLWAIRQLAPQPADHILEIGFGPGVGIQELAKHVTRGRIAGIDFSQTMVDAARERNAEAIRAGIVELHCGDVTALPFADGSFDKAYSIHSVYFWPRPLDALKELLRVLKPGGLLTLTILPKHRWPPNPPGSALEYGTPECIPYFDHELEAMMAAAGFGTTRVAADAEQANKSNFSVLGNK